MSHSDPSALEAKPQGFWIRDCRVDPMRGTITRDDLSERLEPRVMDVLVYLATHRGRVVTKEQIVEEAWGGRFVDDLAVARCISKIRKALGETPGEPRSLRTFPKRGYSLTIQEPRGDRIEPSRRWWRLPAIAGLLGFGTIALLLWGPSRTETQLAGLRLELVPFEGSNEIETSLGRALIDDLSASLAAIDDLEIILPETSSDGASRTGATREGTVAIRGSIRSRPDGFRVVAQLLEVGSGRQLWAESFVGPADDRLQDQLVIADAIAASVVARLHAAGLAPTTARASNDPWAHEHFLRGRAAYRRGGSIDNERSIDHFREALAIAPRSAPAHAGLASALALRSARYGRGGDHVVRAIEHANLALDIDPSLPDAYKARGTALHSLGRFQRARADYDQALGLDPGLETARFNKAVVLHQLGRPAEALSALSKFSPNESSPALYAAEMGHILLELGFEELARTWSDVALAEDPLSAHANAVRARGDIRAGNLSGAARRLDRLLLAYPLDGELLRLRSEVALLQGQESVAAEILRRSFESVRDGLEDLDRIRFASLMPREDPVAKRLLSTVRRRLVGRIRHGADLGEYPRALATIAALEGDHSQALDFLEAAVAAGHRDWRQDLTEPMFAGLAREPAFTGLLRSMQDLQAGERARALAQGLPVPPELGNPMLGLGRPTPLRTSLRALWPAGHSQ